MHPIAGAPAWIEAIGALLTGVATVLAGCAALMSLGAWRRETVGRRKAELAEEVLAQFYRARDILTWARFPVGGRGSEAGASGPADGARVLVDFDWFFWTGVQFRKITRELIKRYIKFSKLKNKISARLIRAELLSENMCDWDVICGEVPAIIPTSAPAGRWRQALVQPSARVRVWTPPQTQVDSEEVRDA